MTDYLTVSDVCRRLHVHPQTVRRMVKRGALRAWRTGFAGPLRFCPTRLAQDIRKLEGEP